MFAFDQSEYIAQYKRTKLKRVPLDMQISDYEALVKAAKQAEQPINTFIKQAINERIQAMNNK